ncbi:MAG: NAD-dependent epimerase/dehydratase family protein [Chitinophagaceae bacterium]|nr:MAG: NAD-dependent epimerase/dehydratase family protein [Chitinophagaceae bacterium]
MKNILVIGSTGMLGKPVTNELIKAGFTVTLLARNIDKTEKLFPGTRVMKGDIFDITTLTKAMEGMDIVYVNLSIPQASREKDPQPEREGVDNIITAANQAGIKKLAYLSSLIKNYQGMNGFNWWAFRIKQSAVDKIKASGISYTIFYPSTFMETFPFQMMRGNNIMMLGKSEAPMWFIAAEDYGRQVVAAFRKDGNENKEFSIQGPEPFTFDEATKVMTDNYKKTKLKVMKAPIGLLKFIGNFIPKLNYGANICEALNKYPEKFESDSAWRDLGKPTIFLAEYAKSL